MHVPYEILGTFDPLLRDAGFRIKFVNFGRHPDILPKIDPYDGLILLGGPMSVNEERQYPFIKTELKLIEKALKRNIPILGICLGSQLIAKTLGASVYPAPNKEIGWYNVNPTEHSQTDPLLKNLKETKKIFQWHGDTFDLPSGSKHLAESTLCPHQAFRFGDKAYGFQFHMEVDKALIERWLRVPEHIRELKDLGESDKAEIIRKETELYLKDLQSLSNETFRHYIELFGEVRNRKVKLPSAH